MKALYWNDKHNRCVGEVPDSEITYSLDDISNSKHEGIKKIDGTRRTKMLGLETAPPSLAESVFKEPFV